MRQIIGQSLLLISVFALSVSPASAGWHQAKTRPTASEEPFQEIIHGRATNNFYETTPFKIRTQPGYKELAEALEQELQPNQNIVYSFSIDKDGNISNLKIRSAGASEANDTKLMEIIRNAAPFTLPYACDIRRGLEIEFWKGWRIQIDLRHDPRTYVKPKVDKAKAAKTENWFKGLE